MFYWIYDIPNWALATLFSVTFIGSSWVGILLTHSRLRRWANSQSDWNEVIGCVVSFHGVLYGILLGLIAVSAQQNFATSDGAIDDEAAALVALYQDVLSYPEPPRSELQGILRAYCQFVIEQEWPVQRRGKIHEGGTTPLADFQRELMSFQPNGKSQEILHVEAIHQLDILIAGRQNRLRQVSTALPAPMWYVVGAGAVLGIVLTWLFYIERLIAHLVLAAIVSLLTGLVVFLIAAMDHPFRGSFSVTPEAFEIVQRSIAPHGATMSPQQITTDLVGKTWSGTLSNGSSTTWALAKDGTTQIQGGLNDSGRWRLSDDGYCVTWSRLRQGVERCYTAEDASSGHYVIRRVTGELVMTVTAVQ
jgi:hypothetical protein